MSQVPHLESRADGRRATPGEGCEDHATYGDRIGAWGSRPPPAGPCGERSPPPRHKQAPWRTASVGSRLLNFTAWEAGAGEPPQLLVVVGSSLWQEVINEEVHTHLK